MKSLIDDLNKEHLMIDEFMRRLESAVAGTNFLPKLIEMGKKFEHFSSEHLANHHLKEEKFLYHWMVEQNKNSDKELIRKMIEDHKVFEQKALWIIRELELATKLDYKNAATLGYEVSSFLSNYREHLIRETSFVFQIAEGLKNQK